MMANGGWHLIFGESWEAQLIVTAYRRSKLCSNEGYKVKTEVQVETPMGAKQSRFIDVVGVKKETGEIKMYQVGDRNKDGQPIAREKSALDDIEQASGIRPQFEDKSIGSQLDNFQAAIGPPSSMATEEGPAEGEGVGEPEVPIE